ncbi:MAG: hypothetical protein QOJ74_649 [Ilumatobacteraceae bacterium]|nr:hypothetical protein [Ilumatobacteraceae bacterium]
MMSSSRSGHRGATTAVLMLGGGALAAASWIGGDHGLAIGLVIFYVIAGFVAYLWAGGEGDVAAILRLGADERQRGLDRDATAIAGLAVSVAAIVGAVIQTARNLNPGPYGIMCVVGGVAYAASLVVLRWRR